MSARRQSWRAKLLADLRHAKHVRAQNIRRWKAGIKSTGETIQCRGIGCNACCYQLPLASFWEGALIAAHILRLDEAERNARVARLQDNWERTASLIGRPATPQAIDDATGPYFEKRIGCPFLDGDRCGIYALRPTACASYFVTSDPELCASAPMTKVLIPNTMAIRMWAAQIDEIVIGRAISGKGSIIIVPLSRAVIFGMSVLTNGPNTLKAAIARS